MNEYYSLLVSIWIFSLNIKTEQKEDERRFHSSYNYLTFPALQPWQHSNGNNYISIFFDGDIYFSHYVEDLGLSGMPSMNNHQMKINWKWNIEHRGEIKYFWIYICLPLIFKTHEHVIRNAENLKMKLEHAKQLFYPLHRLELIFRWTLFTILKT